MGRGEGGGWGAENGENSAILGNFPRSAPPGCTHRAGGGIWAPQKCTWHLLLLSRESLAVLPLPRESGKIICRVYLFFSLLWNRWGGKGQKILCALRVPPVTVLSQGVTAEPFPGIQAKGTARKAPGSARENPEGTSLSLRGHSPAEQHQEQPGQVQEGEQHP